MECLLDGLAPRSANRFVPERHGLGNRPQHNHPFISFIRLVLEHSLISATKANEGNEEDPLAAAVDRRSSNPAAANGILAQAYGDLIVLLCRSAGVAKQPAAAGVKANVNQ
jgi:hypothetical protein